MGVSGLDPGHETWLLSVVWPEGVDTPDGLRYFAMARGEGAPKPYHYRWLLPRLLGEDKKKWRAVSLGSLAGMVPAMRWLTGRWAPGLFVFTLDGVAGTAHRYPVLTDAPAMLAAIMAAAATRQKRWTLAVVLSVLAGTMKESSPVFAATYSTNLLPLVGLISPAVMAMIEPGDDIPGEGFSHDCLTHPVWAAWWKRRGQAVDWKLWVLPWGGLLAGLRGDFRTVSTVVASHAQCVAAVDTERLTQWAWPVLAENTVDVMGKSWPVALTAGWFNPWRTP